MTIQLLLQLIFFFMIAVSQTVVDGIADVVNGVIHVARGNYVEAGFSVIAQSVFRRFHNIGRRRLGRVAGVLTQHRKLRTQQRNEFLQHSIFFLKKLDTF
jgi:hypothetical protein